jgi:predicted DNA-binding protein (UPF0251 family)
VRLYVVSFVGKDKMMTKYEEFEREYHNSGLNQREYGARIGISPSMVHYYLKRARSKPVDVGSVFSTLEINTERSDIITIRTSSGTEITIPL